MSSARVGSTRLAHQERTPGEALNVEDGERDAEHAVRDEARADAVVDGPATQFTVRLTSQEARALEKAVRARGMNRGEWLRALLRRQFSRQRQISHTERGYLRKSLGELHALRQEVTRMRCAVNQSALHPKDVDRALTNLKTLNDRIAAVAVAIRRGFDGDDSYWARLDEPGA